MKKIKESKEIYISKSGDVISFRKSKKGIKIKKQFDKDGYPKVVLKINNKCIHRFIHRLLAEAYIENPENKKYINHKNGIKTDNRLENLEWVTQRENILHAYELGLWCGAKKMK